jgi:hypothetical protein
MVKKGSTAESTGMDVYTFHRLFLGSPTLAQGLWKGEERGRIGRPAVGSPPLISLDFSLQELLVFDLWVTGV